MKRFSYYLIEEIGPFYIAGLVILLMLLVTVFLSEGLADFVARGASPNLVASFLLYSIPSAASMGMPLALLFAALIGITRLGQDAETKAALSLGLSPRNFAWPLILMGLLVSVASFVNNEVFVPWSDSKALEVQKDILIQSPEVFLEEDSFFTDALGRSVHIGRLEPGGNAQDITVIQSDGSRGPKEVLHAETGVLDETAGVWRLNQVRFTSYNNSRVVFDALADTATVPVRKLSAGSSRNPEFFKTPLPKLWERLQNPNSRQPAAWTALHRKFAEPLAATAFALFALGAGLFSFQSGMSLGFVSVLILTFFYYATWSVAKLLGANGVIPAWLAGWLPVSLYFAAALVLLLLSRRR